MKEDASVAHLVEYLEKNLNKGYKLEGLRWALISQKHSRLEIDKAVKIVEARNASKKIETAKTEKVEIVRDEIVVPEKKGFWASLFSKD